MKANVKQMTKQMQNNDKQRPQTTTSDRKRQQTITNDQQAIKNDNKTVKTTDTKRQYK